MKKEWTFRPDQMAESLSEVDAFVINGMNGRKTNGGAPFQASSGERKTKGRKTTLEALEAKIERAKDKVVRTKNAHESAVKELKELMDQRDLLRKNAIVELLMHSKRSYEEIEAFLKSDPNGHD